MTNAIRSCIHREARIAQTSRAKLNWHERRTPSRIPVVIEPNDTQAIITGYSKTEPKLEYLPDAYEGLGGNTVYTSGKDGIFLPGIPVGLTVLEDDYVSVKLFSDPNQLSFVNILIIKENNN